MTAYERAVAEKLRTAQREQRGMSPRKVAQKCLQDFCGRANGFGVALPVDMAAELVRLVEAIVVAERQKD